MLTKYVLQYLIAGTRGGMTRALIIDALNKTPMNSNRLSTQLKLDYKTIQHHLRVLEENNVIAAVNKGKYGAVYHLTADMEANLKLFKEIWKKSG
jgi:DNA-binding transcriptional ArsR family regulator